MWTLVIEATELTEIFSPDCAYSTTVVYFTGNGSCQSFIDGDKLLQIDTIIDFGQTIRVAGAHEFRMVFFSKTEAEDWRGKATTFLRISDCAIFSM